APGRPAPGGQNARRLGFRPLAGEGHLRDFSTPNYVRKIPCLLEAAARYSGSKTMPMRTSPVLIVDDDDAYRASVAALLERVGYQTRESASALAALASVRELRPSC